jgi:outer membrane protein assembly factor BamB
MHTARSRSSWILFAAGVSITLMATTSAPADDWPQWRGPKRDAVSAETGLLKKWDDGGPPLVWDAKKVNGGSSVGTGIASVAIVGDKLYTIGDFKTDAPVPPTDDGGSKPKKADTKGDTYAFCLDANTGKQIWKTKTGPYYFNSFGSGGRSTPTVDGPRLYFLSPQGVLNCLATETGSILWQKDLAKEFGGRMMSGWGYSESPTIDGNKVIVTPGGKKAAMVALEKETGKLIWATELPKESGAGYASIAIAHVGGIKQYITYLAKDPGLIGVDANSGKLLWTYDKVANGTANIPTSLVKDDYVFTSTSYGSGAALLKLVPDGKGGIAAEEQYILTNKQLNNHHGGMVMIGDYIYGGHGQNDGKPFCIEWKTGKLAWGPERGPGSGSAAVVAADGKLYFRYQGGTVALIEASPKELKVVSQFDANIAQSNWPHPVIANGKLYLRGEDTIWCYDLRRKD